MNVHRHLILLVLAFLISGCASASLTRTAALELHQKLGQSHVAASYPEEYKSFIASIAHAETLSQRGELLQAENVFSLALLKGRLLETRSAELASDVTASPPGREKIAQAEVIPVDTATPGIVEESLTSEPAPPDVPPPLPEEQVLPQPEPSPEPAPEPLLQPEPELPQSPPDLPGEEQPTADMKRFIGSRGYYTVRKWDTLKRVGARLGVDWRRLVKINNLDPKAQLKPGQIIAYDNRKIVPSALRDGIVINIADRTLYLLKNGEVRTSYPVALGKPPKPEQDEDWSTPTGRFVITSKEKDPVWRVPQSIQDEMEEHGKQPVKEVPPGKDNPLGKFAMKTSLSGIVIHSTNSPSSINTYASHGCIRVMPEHMEKLFPIVEPRTSGIIVYQPVKLAVSPDGRIFLEVHRDIYDRYKGSLESEVRKLISKRKVEEQVDWSKISALLGKKSGIPEEITSDPVKNIRQKSSVTGNQNTVSINHSSSSTRLP